jgi:nitric oxide reductase NorQ protein
MEPNENEIEVVALRLTKQDSFVITPYIKELTMRVTRYLNAGYPVHLRGPAGTGKTTLAMHVASCFNVPVTIIHGNDEYVPSDLIGTESGYRIEKIVDNYIHTVSKTVDDFQKKWVDNQLTVACRSGFTLIYDEFNRSKPETNNILLNIFEEKMLETNGSLNSERYVKVHPNFKAIFTSNAEEYAGVHKIQDALLDRMITINMGYMDAETEREIVRSRANIDYQDADRIVNIVRDFRNSEKYAVVPSLRVGVMMGKIIKANNCHASKKDAFFRKVAYDMLCSKIDGHSTETEAGMASKKIVDELIDTHCQ